MNAPSSDATPLRAFPRFEQLRTHFDPECGVMWAAMAPQPRPCFNPVLLRELRLFVDGIAEHGGCAPGDGRRIHYAVVSSDVPGVFNLGGDLELFRAAIRARDRVGLRGYARACIDNLFPWTQGLGCGITTISLVQGQAMGGGFETALAGDVLVAERSSRMGFPEILFNLFPGMGAYSFLSRKVGRRVTETLITSGDTYTAEQLHGMGVVDVLAPDGAGEAVVTDYIRRHARQANGRRAFEQVRRDVHAVPREELDAVTDTWVDAALRLSERDLKLMERLTRAQTRNDEIAPAAPPRRIRRVEEPVAQLEFATSGW